jgi:plastocyanin
VRLFDKMRRTRGLGCLALLCVCACALLAQSPLAPVTIQVEIINPKAAKKTASASNRADSSNVVVWLTPIGAGPGSPPAATPAHSAPQIAQIDKSFDPHVLVVHVGTAVQFPNRDPFLHNVFSLFDGRRFDLGFYEAGSSKTVRFDRVGVSFLFCNIHPEMSAAVVAVDTPYYGLSNRAGRVSIPDVPDGRYQLNVWYERSLPEELKSVSRVVTISEAARSLETVKVIENANFSLEHKNKYGQEYIPPANTGPVYGRP